VTSGAAAIPPGNLGAGGNGTLTSGLAHADCRRTAWTWHVRVGVGRTAGAAERHPCHTRPAPAWPEIAANMRVPSPRWPPSPPTISCWPRDP